MNKFIGTGVALITPFNADLSIDHDALKKLVNYNIDNGIDYLVISGTTGESATITRAEKKAITDTIKSANNGRLPLVLGIGGNNTEAIIEEMQSTDFSGIDAILSVSPYYTKPTQEGIYQHYKAISKVTPLPIILYNVPGRTMSNMLPETTVRLARDFDNIIAVKEAGNNQQQYYQLIKDKPDDFLIISGDDDLVLGAVLAGGSGVISVIGQAYPKEFSDMIRLGLEGEAKKAFAIHYQLMDAIGLIFSENNPAGIKALLELKGICKDSVRLPLVPATQDLKNKMKEFMKTL